MKTKVNLKLLKTTSFDSGALGLLAMIVRQFPENGNYRAVILRQGKIAAEVGFEVNARSEADQLNIDLAACEQKAKAREDECAKQGAMQAVGVVSPKGYVLFHASSGEGYEIIVSREGGKESFNSSKLERGDIFAVTLLEPGIYEMKNSIGNASGQIVVNLPSNEDIRRNRLETLYIEASRKGFEPRQIELASSQGLVFRVNEPARIVIEKRGEEAERPSS
jgi:hypothetical protein